MQKLLIPFVVASAVFGTTECAKADDRDAALVVVERAIRAHGGQARLAKVQVISRSVKGTQTLFGKDSTFSGENLMRLPDKYRASLELNADGQKLFLVMTINGDRGWRMVGGMTSQLAADELDEIRENELYITSLTTLLPLKDKAFQLDRLPETKVNGETAVGIKVSSKDHPEAKLYFDRFSGLLVKIERERIRVAGLDVKKEYFFTDYKEIDGVRVATKHTEMTNGKRSTEVTITSTKFPEKADDKQFEKP